MESLSIILIIYGLLFPLVYLLEDRKLKKEIAKKILSRKRQKQETETLESKYKIKSWYVFKTDIIEDFELNKIHLTKEEKIVNFIIALLFPFIVPLKLLSYYL